MILNYCFSIYVTFWWHSRSHTHKKKSNFLLHLFNPLSSSHQFSPCLSRSPLQSSCQPAMSSGVAMAVSWQETAPSVSVATALRSGRMERAAKVGFSCTGGASLPDRVQKPVSPCPRPHFPHRTEEENLSENHLSAEPCLQRHLQSWFILLFPSVLSFCMFKHDPIKRHKNWFSSQALIRVKIKHQIQKKKKSSRKTEISNKKQSNLFNFLFKGKKSKMPLMLLWILLSWTVSLFISLESDPCSFKSTTWLKLGSLLQGKMKRRTYILTFFYLRISECCSWRKKKRLFGNKSNYAWGARVRPH